jgi:dihydroxyacetone kinase-like predicted kinase
MVQKYNQAVDSESAHEILTKKLEMAEQRSQEIEQMEEQAKEVKKQASAKPEKSWMDNPAVKQAGRTAASILTRSLLGVLGLGGSTRRRKTGGLFR